MKFIVSSSALQEQQPPQVPDTPTARLLLSTLNCWVDELVEQSISQRLPKGPANLESEQLCSLDEARRFLGGVTKQTIYNWCSQGILHPHRIGGRIFYQRRELLALLTTTTPQQ